MEYIFGYYDNGTETLKTKDATHSNLTGFQIVTRDYDDCTITDSFYVIKKTASNEDVEGMCYDWYLIDKHSRYVDKVKCVKSELENKADLVDGKVPESQLPDISVDAYTKTETLSEETKTTFGLGVDAVPDNVLNVLSKAALLQIIPKKTLADLAEGDVIQLNENGSPVGFYVAKHNYESALNGAGRTLLVRQYRYGDGVWNTSGVNNYDGSTIDTWNNTTYKAMLDHAVQEAMATTTFYYSVGNSKAVTTLARSVFNLSLTELGLSSSEGNVHGTPLPNVAALRNMNQWTRTARNNNTTGAFFLYSGGAQNDNNVNYTGIGGYRPCFTLPGTWPVEYETALTDAKGSVADLGGVQIATGSYTGTGTSGASNPNSLTFDFEPKMIIIETDSGVSGNWTHAAALRGSGFISAAWQNSLQVNSIATWSGKTVSWYSNSNANLQANTSGTVYRYLAIG